MWRRSVDSVIAEAWRRRFLLRDFNPRWCRANACARFTFPVPVRLNRFAAARFVLILGIVTPMLSAWGASPPPRVRASAFSLPGVLRIPGAEP